MPLQITMNPRPAGNFSISANQRARFSSVVSLGWDQITGKPTITDFAETLLDDETAAAARATLGLTYGTGVREVLTANRTYYIRSDGSDSNTGLADTAGGAFLTVQAAFNKIMSSIDMAGYRVFVQIGSGSFAGGTLNGPTVGGGGSGIGPVIVLGAGSASTTITSPLIFSDNARACIGSFKITVTGNNIQVNNHSHVHLYDGDIDLGAATGYLVYVGYHSTFNGQTGLDLKISGGGAGAFFISTHSSVTLSYGGTYTITGTPAFSAAFVTAIVNSSFNPGWDSAFVGSATGIRHNISVTSSVDMENVTADLPGDVAGTVTWGSSFYATNALDIIGVGDQTLQLTGSSLAVTPQSSGFAAWSGGTLSSAGSSILAAANGGTGVANAYTITLSSSNLAVTPQSDGVATWTTGQLLGSFYKFSGPATSVKTFTLPNANETIATLGQQNLFTATNGSTSYTSYFVTGSLTVNAQQGVQRDITSLTASNITNLGLDFQINNSTAAQSYASLRNWVNIPAANSTAHAMINGQDNQIYHAGSGTITTMQGMTFSAFNSGSATVTTMFAANYSLVNNGTGTVTNATAINIARPTGAAGSTWTTPIGILINDQTPTVGGTVTNPSAALRIGSQSGTGAFAIDQVGSGLNRFAARTTFVGATAGFGYGTGAGGTQTQGTSKSTAVTLDKVTGLITTHNATLNAATIVTFVLNNSAVAATDLILATHESGGTTGAYTINARATGAGTAAIDIRNNTAGNLGEAIVIRFAVIKSVSA